MPEGHTIHRAARLQRPLLVGECRVSSPQGRFADGAAVLDGTRLAAIDAYGKHLIYRWESGALLHVHLGLFGRFLTSTTPPPPPRSSVRCRIEGPKECVDLIGPTACELIDPAGLDTLLGRLGPDPLRDDAPQAFLERAARSRRPIGDLVLDQSFIAGIGNVYRAEGLFLCGIDPHREARSLTDPQRGALWETFCQVLRAGERAGRIVTTDPHEIGVTRSRMRRRDRTYVYGQDTCRRCDAAVRQEMRGGRRLWWCPECQR